jgi:hypothetical protein
MNADEAFLPPPCGDGLQLTHGDQSVTLHSAAYRRGGGESTQ